MYRDSDGPWISKVDGREEVTREKRWKTLLKSLELSRDNCYDNVSIPSETLCSVAVLVPPQQYRFSATEARRSRLI